MSDVYTRLAKKLDELPNGFAATESGVELKILRKIVTPEEAEMMLKMRPLPETVETIAERLGTSVPDLQATLDAMAAKGLIGAFKMAGEDCYMLIPFVMGFLESGTLNRISKELAELVEEYMPELTKTYGGFAPAEARVIPISTQVDAELQVHRYEDVRRMIGEARSFMLQECWCRQQRAAAGHACKHSLEVCLAFSIEEGEFEKYSLGRIISKEEALKVIDKVEEEGLVHCAYNVVEGQVFVCACCPCCCGLLRGIKEFKSPYILARSNLVAAIDEESCSECGVCAEERCPMDAIVQEDGAYKVQAERCIGCGACAPTCPTESIKLVRRPESEQDQPPQDLMDWGMKRAASRGIEIKIE